MKRPIILAIAFVVSVSVTSKAETNRETVGKQNVTKIGPSPNNADLIRDIQKLLDMPSANGNSAFPDTSSATALDSGFRFEDGNMAQELCRTTPNYYLEWYVRGVFDTFHISATNIMCIPSNATPTQLSDVMCKFVRENPAKRSDAASTLALASWSVAFPCH